MSWECPDNIAVDAPCTSRTCQQHWCAKWRDSREHRKANKKPRMGRPASMKPKRKLDSMTSEAGEG
jgi:hypothetical protein